MRQPRWVDFGDFIVHEKKSVFKTYWSTFCLIGYARVTRVEKRWLMGADRNNGVVSSASLLYPTGGAAYEYTHLLRALSADVYVRVRVRVSELYRIGRIDSSSIILLGLGYSVRAVMSRAQSLCEKEGKRVVFSPLSSGLM